MPSLPSPVRAALGLAATVLDEARHLPDRAIELPMRAVSTALKFSLRAQQRYAELAARGDEVLSGRSTGDEAPSWATFDTPLEDVADGGRADVTPARRPRPAPVRAVPAAKTARTTKPVRAPRTGKASAFDRVSDEAVEAVDPAAAENPEGPEA
ncbi:MAG TPA: hypothetical protein VIG48_11790 [Jatrophihabitans sp.]|jgi:hypothetical protein